MNKSAEARKRGSSKVGAVHEPPTNVGAYGIRPAENLAECRMIVLALFIEVKISGHLCT
jgi:hypothetical protein